MSLPLFLVDAFAEAAFGGNPAADASVELRADDGATAAFACVSRFFAPSVGLDEDAVTGSADCVIGPYWATRLGRPTLRAYQASARCGALQVTVGGARVTLFGRALTTMAGSLLPLPA